MKNIRKLMLIFIFFIIVFTFHCAKKNGGEDEIVLTKAVKIGNPNLERFPNNDSKDRYARSVWDMHYYNGRVYIGSGDILRNRGPIDVWSFETKGKEVSFKKEITVDEEQVHRFIDYAGKLFIPGYDAQESWDFGNLYIKDGGVWQKLRTIPHGLHICDVALFNRNLYVYMTSDGYSGILESCDMGQTWKYVMKGYHDDRLAGFGPMVPLKDFLLIMGRTDNTPCVYKYGDRKIERLLIPLFPSSNTQRKNFGRLVRFKDGVLYAPVYLGFLDSQCPLFFLNDFEYGAVIIEQFREDNVRDIVVRDKRCYVLTASAQEDECKGSIYSSSDLESWTKRAEFSVPALPYSFELLNGVFYVGLGHRFLIDKWRSKEEGWAEDDESGSIWRIEE